MRAVFALVLVAACGPLVTDRPDDDGLTALMRASRRADTAAVVELLRRTGNVDVEVPGPDVVVASIVGTRVPSRQAVGFTALDFAVRSRRVANAQLLIANGANVNHVPRGNLAPLDVAVFNNDTAMTRLLLKAGAKTNPHLLGMAVYVAKRPALEVLLQSGVNPNALGGEYAGAPASAFKPLLVIAARRGDPAVVRLLLAAGARPDARDGTGWTALRYAHEAMGRRVNRRGAEEILAILDSAGARDTAGIRANELTAAVARNDVVAVRAALRAGADVNTKDTKGVPALVHAIARRQSDLASVLLDAGADVNVKSHMTVSPLTAAIENNDVEMVKVLLAKGARRGLEDGRGVSPLMITALNARADIAALLLADTTLRIPKNALQHAVGRADTAQVRMFLERGADPTIQDGFLLHVAARTCDNAAGRAVVRTLLDRGLAPDGWPYSAPFNVAAGRCGKETLQDFLDKGANVNRRDYNGVTALMSAAAFGRLDNVRFLLASGAAVNIKDRGGYTALQHARTPEMRQELLKAGARGDTTQRPRGELIY